MFHSIRDSAQFPAFSKWLGVLLIASLFTLASSETCNAKRGGDFTIKAIDAKTKKPIAVRMHLLNAKGRTPKIKSKEIVVHGDHFVFDGEITLELPRGNYRFEMEAGPEYKVWTGHFEMLQDSSDEKTIEMHRFSNLAEEGWFAGDLYVARRTKGIDLVMKAEHIDFLSLVSEQNIKGKFSTVNAWNPTTTRGSDHRAFSAATTLYIRSPGGLLRINDSRRQFIKQLTNKELLPLDTLNSTDAEQEQLHIVDPFSWDLPLWLSKRTPTSFMVLSSFAGRKKSTEAKLTGRPRDKTFFPGEIGTGRWAEKIYFHLLNSGFRVPPSAGSGSGNSKNPVGLNRVYVQSNSSLRLQSWLDGLKQGRVFVSNGPLLRVNVEGKPPGTIFKLEENEVREFKIALQLSTREKIDYLKIIKNGRPAFEIRLEKWIGKQGRLPELKFDEPGWFLIQAVTNNSKVYKYASSGPFYVEVEGKKPHISKESTQFFLDWLKLMEKQPHHKKARSKKEDLADIQAAKKFWQELNNNATVE